MKKEENSFLDFMNILYYIFIALVILGILIAIGNLPDNSGGIKLVIVLSGLIQILILTNLITLNKNYHPQSEDSHIIEKIENGPFEEFYDNRKLKKKGMIKNWKKDGVWEFYYYDGSLQMTKKFDNGNEIS